MTQQRRLTHDAILLSLPMAALLVAAGCHKQSGPPPGAGSARPPAMVTVAPAMTQEVPVYLDEIGKMVPIESVTITPSLAEWRSARRRFSWHNTTIGPTVTGLKGQDERLRASG